MQTRQQLNRKFWNLIDIMCKKPNVDHDLISHYVMDFEEGKTYIRTLIQWLEKEIV